MKRLMTILMAFLMVFSLCACSSGTGQSVDNADQGSYEAEDREGDFTFLVYTKNGSGTELMSYSYTTSETEFEDRIELMAELLVQMPPEPGQIPAIPSFLQVPEITYDNHVLYMNFGSEYADMDKITEVLCRAAIVSTMCQLPEVEYVFFRVDGVSLLDSDGVMVGYMRASDFIRRATDMNDVVTETVRLYFANQEGTGLEGVETEITYASNSTPERAVIEALINYGAESGILLPGSGVTEMNSGLRATVPSMTEIYSVQVRNGICYVNLSSAFEDQSMNMDPILTIYSVVNSLTGLENVDRVQIMIEGDSSLVFRDTLSLESPFTMNEGLVVK